LLKLRFESLAKEIHILTILCAGRDQHTKRIRPIWKKKENAIINR